MSKLYNARKFVASRGSSEGGVKVLLTYIHMTDLVTSMSRSSKPGEKELHFKCVFQAEHGFPSGVPISTDKTKTVRLIRATLGVILNCTAIPDLLDKLPHLLERTGHIRHQVRDCEFLHSLHVVSKLFAKRVRFGEIKMCENPDLHSLNL